MQGTEDSQPEQISSGPLPQVRPLPIPFIYLPIFYSQIILPVEDIKLRSKDYVNKYKKLYDNYIMN
jgi:hypothetical protein